MWHFHTHTHLWLKHVFSLFWLECELWLYSFMHMPKLMYGGHHTFSYLLPMSLSENQMNMCLCPMGKSLLKKIQVSYFLCWAHAKFQVPCFFLCLLAGGCFLVWWCLPTVCWASFVCVFLKPQTTYNSPNYPQFVPPAIRPGQEWWQTLLEIIVSCSQWKGSACIDNGSKFFFFFSLHFPPSCGFKWCYQKN
jgi:hypothetical protein